MSAPRNNPPPPLAVICAGGVLPFVVADAALSQGRAVTLFAYSGIADATRVAAYPHHWIVLGQAGRMFDLIRGAGCRDVVFIGGLARPPIWKLRLDWLTVRLLPRLIAMFAGGDNRLLSGIGRIFEEQGFRTIGAHEIAPSLLVPAGDLTQRKPTAADRSDIAKALEAVRAIGAADVGQAAVVANGQVLAVEDRAGTNAMLAKVANLRAGKPAGERGGVLVKAAKPGQDRRYDLPTIGPRTVEAVAKAGLAGIAVVAGDTLGAELDQAIALANRLDIFIAGVEALP